MKFASDTVQRRIASPLGEVVIAATPRGIAGLWFMTEQRHQPAELLAAPTVWPMHPAPHAHIDHGEALLAAYFAGRSTEFPLTYDWPIGTPFQLSVWKAMLSLTYGQTCSYADLAHGVGRPRAVRAVGAAVGRNPISVFVPCHRVVGTSGALTGYGGGLSRKAHLLALESHSLQPELV
jgi:methylated-DNA-[protein]-cysteine S-methyltransferase